MCERNCCALCFGCLNATACCTCRRPPERLPGRIYFFVDGGAWKGKRRLVEFATYNVPSIICCVLALSSVTSSTVRSQKDQPNVKHYEKVKRFVLLADAFTIDDGFLTPKMSLKRPVVAKAFEDVINGLYEV